MQGKVTGAVAASCVTALVVIACMDGQPTTAADGVLPVAPQRTSMYVYSADELHRANPLDWVGRAHNVLLLALQEELKGANVNRRAACEKAAERLAFADLGPGAPTDRTGFAERLRGAMATNPLCAARRPRSSTASWKRIAALSDTVWAQPSQTALAMIDSMEAETEAASSANDLAAKLSPFYNTSLTMGFPDSAVVAFGVAIAQNSWDGWGNETQFTFNLESQVDEILLCEQGQAESAQYQLEDVTYICQNSEWLMAAGRSARPAPLFRNASLSTSNDSRMLTASRLEDVVRPRLHLVAQAGVTCHLGWWQKKALLVGSDLSGVAWGSLAFWLTGNPGIAVEVGTITGAAGSYWAEKFLAWDQAAC